MVAFLVSLFSQRQFVQYFSAALCFSLVSMDLLYSVCSLASQESPQANIARSLWGTEIVENGARPAEPLCFSFTVASCYHSVWLVKLCE